MAELGAAIREYRERKGWTQAQLAKAIVMTYSAISKFESGVNVPCRDTARRIDEALGAGGRIWTLRDRLDDNPDAKWIQKSLRYESRAIAIRHTANLVPALLQTEEYTRIILERNLPHYGGDLAQKIQHRQQRREILARPDAPLFTAVLDEAALHTVIGDRRVMCRQLLDLVEASHRPRVEIRVTPFSGSGPTSQVGEMTIMDLRGGPTVIYRAGGVRGIYITAADRVAEYLNLYDRLHAAALDPEASRVLIRKVVEENYQ
ncbi:helix-turn-helix transcriptional regulator [Streptomyces sp. ET3-23]|uniref:helix-turn-helix domain-containing protein n=1 Tax=Streptomyces sp. ET3-23 TaxID=2885643 RepID=UPI001D11EBC1|nr:helix-turn-helix transcriptional regulator [Streptomyces sp. ET3-23]MCC2280577.1 helix-turn-helix transcriptional regulator [Streptomyces sp. ET3-23]